MTILIALFVTGWLAASALGTLAYFRGEQSKPIHERNWRSGTFETLSKSITGSEIDYTTRVPGFDVDTYSSQLLPEA
jgi:hypothetical protein